MAIQTCDQCNHHFSWKEIQTSLLRGFKPIQCKQCKTSHRIKEHSKIIMAMITAFPIVFFVIVLASALGFSPAQTFITGFIWLLIVLSVLPYIARYETEQGEEFQENFKPLE